MPFELIQFFIIQGYIITELKIKANNYIKKNVEKFDIKIFCIYNYNKFFMQTGYRFNSCFSKGWQDNPFGNKVTSEPSLLAYGSSVLNILCTGVFGLVIAFRFPDATHIPSYQRMFMFIL